ncbi:MAG: TonB-dependent receptor [Nitrobacter sp. 62-13]|uniref:TonB-dependent receptor n=1 Tax=Nitrobacter sp. 62-13 TaxID=1895797 RepID=UPI0009612D60|nr:TonB-dependent siderophore receptor [Nitrobacter sp. 62-13]OJU29592.1 MAG: TonB-dependent receptor [Nitrobacter sp. 62-13]
MGISSVGHTDGTNGDVTGQSSVVGWSKAMIGIAAVMLIPDSADAQPAPSADDLPQVRVTAPKRQAKKRTAHRAPVRAAPAPVVAPSPSNVQVNPIVGDGHGVTGYQAPAQAGISRLPVPLADTPQTVNVVTQQVLQEQRLLSMEDALRTVPGITFSAGEGGQQGDSPIVRGFAARGDMFRDGIRDPGWYTRDLFSADRVEVHKGPSGFAFGRGSTGGAINTVSKLPQTRDFVDGTISGVTSGGYRAEVDANGTQGNLSGRIAAMYQDIPTESRDHVFTKRWGVAPSFKAEFSPDTRAILSYVYQGEDSVPDYGRRYLPAPAYSSSTGALTNPGYFGNGAPTPPMPIPRSNWFGVASGPLADRVLTDTHIGTMSFEHDFDKDLKISNATRYIAVNRMARPTAPRGEAQADNVTPITPGYPVELMTIGRQHFETLTDNTLLINQTDLTGKFWTGGWQHTFAMGVEAARETRDQSRANYCVPGNLACRTSVWDPVDTSYGGPNTGFGLPNSTVSTNYAVYGFDQVKLNEYFELLGSIRYDNFRSNYTNLAAVPASQHLSRTDDMVSWRVGGVFHPTHHSSVYAAYGVSYNPAAEFQTLSDASNNAANVLLPPEKNTTLEVGAKADVLNGKLTLSGAVFRIEKTNLRIPVDPVLNTALVLGGLARVDGIELGVAGKLTDQWSVFAGYSYLDSKIVNTTDLSQLGNQLPNTPPHNFTLWTAYDLTPQWTVGGGLTYAARTFVNPQNTSYVPDYWKLDLMTSYKVTKDSLLQLNVYNVTDELYYSQFYQGHAVPAAGRTAMLTYRYHFEPPPPVADYPVKAARYVSK